MVRKYIRDCQLTDCVRSFEVVIDQGSRVDCNSLEPMETSGCRFNTRNTTASFSRKAYMGDSVIGRSDERSNTRERDRDRVSGSHSFGLLSKITKSRNQRKSNWSCAIIRNCSKRM